MELNNAVIVMMLQDENRWGAVKTYAATNDMTEYSAIETAAKNVLIEPFDETLNVSFADEMYNWLIAQ